MRRATITLLAFVVVLGTTLVATGNAASEPTTGAEDHLFVRWDIIRFRGNIALAGGSDVSTDAASGDTIRLTGSGHSEPIEGEAAGGGTFVHRDEDGDLFGRGWYQVTGFISWHRIAGGSLAGTGLVDGIGNGTGAHPNEREESSGVLKLRVHFVQLVHGEPRAEADGVLTVFCHLPGSAEDVPEGVQVMIPALDLNFTPTSGFTLFHVLR